MKILLVSELKNALDNCQCGLKQIQRFDTRKNKWVKIRSDAEFQTRTKYKGHFEITNNNDCELYANCIIYATEVNFYNITYGSSTERDNWEMLDVWFPEGQTVSKTFYFKVKRKIQRTSRSFRLYFTITGWKKFQYLS